MAGTITLHSRVEELGLPAGLCDRLVRWGYGTVGALMRATPSDLLAIPDVGPHRVADIGRALQEHGLSLSDEVIDVRGAHPVSAPVMDALRAGADVDELAEEIGVPPAALRAWRSGCTPTERQARRIEEWVGRRRS